MRRCILVFVLVLACVSVSAQKPTKEEKKEARLERRAEAERQRHIKDSLWRAECHREDSLYREKRKKQHATDIVAIVPLSAATALDRIAKELVRSSFIIEVNKEYGTIKTEPVFAGMTTYSLYFAVEGTDTECTIRACAFSHESIGVAIYGIVAANEVTMKMENRGMEGSTNRIAFGTIERILQSFEGAYLNYQRSL